MNNILTSAIGFLNGLFAVIIVLIVTAAGFYQNGLIGGLFGLVGGFLLAILVCGILAVAISIRNELVGIKEILSKRPQ